MERRHPYLRKLMDILWHPDIYNVASALRGPDSRNKALKRIFTARIRALLGLKSDIDLPIEVREDSKIDLGDIVYAILNVSSEDRHYLEHTELAVSSLSALLGDDEIEREMWFLEELARLLRFLTRNEDGLLQVKAIDKIAELLVKYSDYIR